MKNYMRALFCACVCCGNFSRTLSNILCKHINQLSKLSTILATCYYLFHLYKFVSPKCSHKLQHSSLYVSPCGRHILFFLQCMPVRPYVTLPLSEPYLQEPFLQKNCKKVLKNIPTEVEQQKNQNSILPKILEVLAQKNTFWICVLSRPDLGNYKR